MSGARWDRIVASDPGLTRLTGAARAALSVGVALGLELLVATLLGIPATIPMMVGAILSMMGAFGVADPTRAGRAVSLLSLPLFFLAGAGLALAVDRWRVLSLAVFVLVMFVAVVIRRFGPRWMNGGMVAFIGYFLTLFLQLTPAHLGPVLLGAGVALVWSLLLTLVLWPDRPARVLGRMVRAFEGRVRATADAAADLLAGGEDRLERRLLQVTESALIIDGQLGAPGAVVDDGTAEAVRRILIDDELATRALVDAVRALARADTPAPEPVRTLLDALRRGSWAEVARRAGELDETATGVDEPAQVLRRIAAAADGLAQRHAARRRPITHPITRPITGASGSGEPFAPAVVLLGGAMPGAVPTVTQLLAEGTGRWARISLTSRQAVQVAVATGLAIVVGDALSGQRYYWAVLAAFLMFAGTATSAQSAAKAVNRVVGTLLGIVAAIPLVTLTGHAPAVVLALVLLSIFGAFYVFRVSYALMAFFITLLIGELYALLGSFTPELMLLRLEETAVGAAIGLVVALVVLPVRTRPTTVLARRSVLEQVRVVLEQVADVLRDPTATPPDLRGASRVLDARLHQLLQLGAALVRPLPVPPNGERGRRLMLYTSLAHHVRSLVREVERGGPALAGPRVAHVVERMVDLSTALCADEPRIDPAAAAATTELLSAVDLADPRTRRFVHQPGYLHDALVSLAADAPAAAGAAGPALIGQVRTVDRTPVAAVLTLADPNGREQDRACTSPTGRYRLRATAPGVHLLICTPDEPGAAPVAQWVHLADGMDVRNVELAGVEAVPRACPRTPARTSSRIPMKAVPQPPANGGRTSTTALAGSGRSWSRAATSSTR